MATSVFSADSSKPTVLKAGKAIVTVDNKTLIALNVTIQFQRNVEVLPALSKKRVISISEPTGQFTAETIIARGNDSTSAFRLTDNDCSAYDMKVKLEEGACDASGKTFTCKNCFTQAVQVTAQGGRGFIGAGFTVTFTALEMS